MASLSSTFSSAGIACPVAVLPVGRRVAMPVTQPRVSCSGGDDDAGGGRIDRRNVLIGLGGLYGATSLGFGPSAVGAPVAPPDLSKSGPAAAAPTICCPPNFQLPDRGSPIRVRPAAHLVDGEYLVKYKQGIALMKAVPANDPRSFTQQANVHCAYDQRKNFTDPDWLNTGFLFYDENAQLLRVTVRGSLDQSKLRDTYQDVPIPWIEARPRPLKAQSSAAAAAKKQAVSQFPATLDKVVKVTVKRPRKSRSKKEKEEEEEVLVIDGIEATKDTPAKFDVYINVEEDAVAGMQADEIEFAGSFVNVPHKHGRKSSRLRTCLRLGITELLEELGAEDDEELVAIIVPRLGKDVTIGGVRIEYSS